MNIKCKLYTDRKLEGLALPNVALYGISFETITLTKHWNNGNDDQLADIDKKK